MCGRYTLAGTDPSQLRARWPIGERLQVCRRFNVAPGDDVLAVVQRSRGTEGPTGPEGTLLRWGLVPFWASDPKEIGVKTINARRDGGRATRLSRCVPEPPLPDPGGRLL